MTKRVRNLRLIAYGLAAFAILLPRIDKAWRSASAPHEGAPVEVRADALDYAYRRHQSNLEVTGAGVVVRVLPDDRDGLPHQRFILRLPSGQTVLVAHNLDLAARLTALDRGDTVRFLGEYEWNPSGGVVHWTHRDPSGRHQAGWLEHEGQRVQ